MTTTTKRKKTAARPKKARAATRTPQTEQQPVTNRKPRSGTKQDQVLKMLRSASGTTVPAIMKATGWQQHSVHGFLSGVVRKRLGLTLTSEGEGEARVYRIVAGATSEPTPEGEK